MFRRMEGRTENFTPGDNCNPRGQNSPLGNNFATGGQSLPLGAKLIIALWYNRLAMHCLCVEKRENVTAMVPCKVARFFSVETYQNVKNKSNEHKLYQKAINYKKWP
jgi:hypothetical protein